MSTQYLKNELNMAFWSRGWLLGLAFVFSFFTTMLMLTTPLFMLLIYDRVLSARSQETLVALFGLVVVLVILMGMFDYSRRRILARFGAQFQEVLEARVLKAVEKQRANAGANGASTTRTKELDGLRGFFHSNSLISIMDFMWTPIFLGAVFLFHPVLGWVAVSGIVGLFLLSGLQSVLSAHLNEDATGASGMVGKLTRTMAAAQPTIGSQNMAVPIQERWMKARDSARDTSIALNDRLVWFSTITKVIRMLFQSAILALGAFYVLRGEISVGAMVACFILLARVFLPVEQFLKQIPKIRRARQNWQSLNETLKLSQSEQAFQGFDAPPARLALNNINVAHTDKKNRILDDLSFEIAPGQLVQIIGDVSAGKSTLARVILNQQTLQSGTAIVGGANAEQLGVEQMSRFFGHLPEDIGFYPGTIAENIAGMSLDNDMGRAIRAAKQAGAHRMISALPNGYRTKLDTLGSVLSKGQRNKVALARAFFGTPPIVLLDEPGAAIEGSILTNPEAMSALKNWNQSYVIFGRVPYDLPIEGRRLHLQNGTLTEMTPRHAASTGKILKPKIVRG